MLINTTTYRIIYGDTDKMGIVYHANYLRWFEIGRSEMFRAWGMPYKAIEARGYFMPVSEVQCKFLTPAGYDDLLQIETTLDTSIKAGMRFTYNIFSENREIIHVKGSSRHAFINSNGKVVRPPKFMTELIYSQINKNQINKSRTNKR